MTHTRPWPYFFQVLRPHTRLLMVALVGIVGAAGSLLAITRGAQYLVDTALSDPSGGGLNMAMMLMIAGAVCMAVCSYLRATSVTEVSELIGRDIRTQVFTHLIRLDPGFHARHATGDLISRLGFEIGYVQSIVNATIPNSLRNGLLMLGALGLMAMTSLPLTMLCLLAIPLLSVPIAVMMPRLRAQNKQVNETIADLMGMMTESLGAIATIKLNGAEASQDQALATAHERLHAAHRKAYTLRGLFAAVIIVIVFSLIAFILWSGGQDVLAGRLSQGEVAAFVMYAVIAAASLATLVDTGQSMGQARAGLERLLDILATHSALPVPAQPLPLPQTEPRFSFDNVWYQYAPDLPPALSGVSFEIAPRSTTALVGPSGAGKSTIFALLLRLYDPNAGLVRLDGQDIRDFDLTDLRRLFGVIPQEPDMFGTSVARNIAFGLSDAPSMAQLESAARQANAHDFIARLPSGYDTLLGERGVGLSVGQKQRIAIARALIRDPRVLMMDEATSALDAESERLVQDALTNAATGRTALVIAHRLATIRGADQILVFDKGRLVAKGTHDSLMQAGGLYAHLAGLQFLG